MLRGFAFNQRLIVRAKNFCKQGHAQLREEDTCKSKRKWQRLKGFAKIGRDACAEGVRQRGEQEVQGTGEFEKGSH